MRKSRLKLCVLVVLILLRLHIYAYDFELDGIYYDMLSTSDMTCQVVKGDNLYSGFIQIPNSVNYKSKNISVIGIGDKAFSYCNNLQSILLPDGISYIGKDAFAYCSSLIQVDLSESISIIGENAFNGCKALEKITIPSNVINVENSLFYNCSSLRDITLSKKVKKIGSYSFGNCINLSEILLPDELERIETGAFDNCALSAVKIPNSVDYLGANVFANCQLLNSISLPNNLDVINSRLFENCTSLCDINFPVSIKKIGAYAFAGCKGLKSINFSHNVMTIESYAFSNCNNIDEIFLPENLTSIEKYAFNECSSLTKIDFKNCSNPFTIWEYAFYNCRNLTNVTLPSSLEKLGVGVFWGTNMDICFEYSETPLTIYSCKNNSGKIFNPFQFCSVESLSIGRGTKVIVPTYLLNGNDYPASTAWGNINSLKKLDVNNTSIPTYVLDNNRKTLEEIKWNSKQKLPNEMSNFPELKILYLYDINPPSCPSFTNMQYMDIDVFVPKNSLDRYKSAEGWKNFWNIKTYDYEVSGINDSLNDDYSETRIYTINGRQIHTDVQKLPSGLYIVKRGTQVDKIRIYNK